MSHSTNSFSIHTSSIIDVSSIVIETDGSSDDDDDDDEAMKYATNNERSPYRPTLILFTSTAAYV